jgi:Tol biopolymer transport system component
MGGAMHKVRENAMAWSVSRDGAWVPFGADLGEYSYRELWIMRPDGSQARRLFDAADEHTSFVGAEFSPDGHRLAYVQWRQLADKYELSIESRDLKGGPPETAVPIPFDMEDWTWAPDGRIITSFPDPIDPSGHTCNFWQNRIEVHTGKPSQQARRMTDWSGFCMDQLSVTADGKRLAFRRTSIQSGVYLADFQAKGSGISTPRALIQDESRNQLAAWTSDSKAVIFTSNRNGRREIYRQSLDQGEPQRIVTLLDEGPEPNGHALIDWMVPRVSPDGSWILYLAIPKESGSATHVQLMRIPIAGGTPQLVLSTALRIVHSLRCARSPATLCVIGEWTSDHKTLLFTAFDPIRGRGRELARFDTQPTADAEYAWDLSPDGSRIAVLRRSEAIAHVLSLAGLAPREFLLRGWSSLQTVDWAPDGKGLFLSAATRDGSALLRTNLQGDANLLWEANGSVQPSSTPFMGGASVSWAAPSPDGRHLAICRWSFNANIWMLENF